MLSRGRLSTVITVFISQKNIDIKSCPHGTCPATIGSSLRSSKRGFTSALPLFLSLKRSCIEREATKHVPHGAQYILSQETCSCFTVLRIHLIASESECVPFFFLLYLVNSSIIAAKTLGTTVGTRWPVRSRVAYCSFLGERQNKAHPSKGFIRAGTSLPYEYCIGRVLLGF